jgi:hypothetical protein
MFEFDPYVSFANCRLPYYIGGEIAYKDDLLVQTTKGMQLRCNFDVRVISEVVELITSTQ